MRGRFAIGWLVLLAGCGSSLPPRAPVAGLVTLDGQPLVRGTVTFAPDRGQGTIGPVAVGEIGADGRYRLTTDRHGAGGDGAVVGFHRVRVQSREAGEPGTLVRSLIPERYGDPATSGLTAKVEAGKENHIDLELKSEEAR
jgi:hypothetical protein